MTVQTSQDAMKNSSHHFNSVDSRPLQVSVVMPTYNRPRLFADALASVKVQSYRDWEVVIVDDASEPPVTAPSLSLDDSRYRLLRNARSLGGAASKAAGGNMSSGDVVAYLDDDDLYQPEFLQSAMDVLSRHADIDVLFIGVDWFGNMAESESREQKSALARVFAIAPPRALEPDLWAFDRDLLAALLNTVPMCFQRPVVRRSALERIGVHRSDCLLWDCEWALRAALSSRCALLDRPLYRQRVHGQQYHSLPDHLLARLRSGAEMTLRLYQNPPPGASLKDIALLKEGASRYAFDLAYSLSKRGSLKEAMHYWYTSQRIRPDFKRFKFPFGALARAAGQIINRNR